MKRRIAVSITILLAVCATFAAQVERPQGQGQNPQQLFSRALIAERGAGNLDQAIQLYQRVAKESTTDRTLAAQALLGAARAHQKLGEAAQSRDLYALVLRTYPEQAEQAAIARDNLAATGIVQGTVMRAGTREPVAEATVSLSGGPLDPEILTQLQDYLKNQGLNVTVSPYGFADAKFTQELTDALGARGNSLANPAWRAIINQLTRATDARFSAKTDGSGRFTIKDIPPGRYTVKSESEGYFPLSDGSEPLSANVSSGRTALIEVSMTRGAVITGRITDGAGQPQSGVTVQAHSIVYQAGFPVLQSVVQKPTNDQGEYRLFWLAAGEYVISAVPGELINARRGGAPVPPGPGGLAPTVPQTFYPGSADISAAVPIFIRGDAPVSGVDIRLRNTPTFRIMGEIRSHIPSTSEPPPDRLDATLVIRTRQSNTPDTTPTTIGVPLTRSGNAYSGKFELNNVLPGPYLLTASMGSETAAARGGRGGGRGPRGGGGPAPTDGQAAASPQQQAQPQRGLRGITRAEVDVNNGDVSSVAMDIYSNTTVNGTVTVDGKPPGRVVARVALQPDGVLARIGSYQGLAGRPGVADGQTGAFTIPNVLSGKYRVEMGSAGSPELYLADVRQGGVSVFESGFEVGRDTPGPLQVQLRSGARTVEGTVRDARGRTIDGAVAVLIPPKELRENRARYYTAKTDASGRFTIQGVAPGTYSLFSWENMPDGAYFNDRFVSRNEDAGRRINVVQQSAVGANITLIPNSSR